MKLPTKPKASLTRRLRSEGRAPQDALATKPDTVARCLAIGPRYFRRHKTGQTAHFRSWLAVAGVQKALKSMRTNALADRTDDTRLARGFLALAPQFPTVHDLAQARREDLLQANGVGRATLRKLHAYLTEHRVPVSWEA